MEGIQIYSHMMPVAPRRSIAITAFVLMLASSSTQASVTGLWTWQLNPNAPTLLLPKVNEENPEATLNRLLKKLHEDPDYRDMEGVNDLPTSSNGIHFEELRPLKEGEAETVVLSNRPNQLTNKSKAIANFLVPMKRREIQGRALPVGQSLILSEQELAELDTVLDKRFGSFILTGGDDPHPTTYGKGPDRGHALGDINAARDRELQRHLQYAIAHDKPVLAVCGAHQLLAIACGMGFHQDIHKDGVTSQLHHSENASVIREVMIVRRDSILGRLLGKSLSEGFGVHKYHHAAAEMPPDGVIPGLDGMPPTYVVALEKHGKRKGRLVEAIELDGKSILSVQFHPEKDQTPAERKIMSLVAEMTRLGQLGPVPAYRLTGVIEKLWVPCMEETLTKDFDVR